MRPIETGQLTEDRGGRYCVECKSEHGHLYICPSYPQELKDKLLMDGEIFRQECKSGDVKFTITTRTDEGYVTITKSWNEMLKERETPELLESK